MRSSSPASPGRGRQGFQSNPFPGSATRQGECDDSARKFREKGGAGIAEASLLARFTALFVPLGARSVESLVFLGNAACQGERAVFRFKRRTRSRPVTPTLDVLGPQSVLGGMADAKDVDRLAVDGEQNAIHIASSAVKQFAEVDPKIGSLLGRRATLWTVGQGTDRRKQSRVPPGGGRWRPLILPNDRRPNVDHRLRRDVKSMRHGSLRRDGR